MGKRQRAGIDWHRVPPTHETFKPYAITIGQTAIAWNALHETMRDLFTTIMGGQENDVRFNALWHSISSDRTQREMIRGVAKDALPQGDFSKDAISKIKWLLDQANKIADARNDAIHAPLISLISPDVVWADAGSGHPRAINLEDKDLLSDFEWCRDNAWLLKNFCLALNLAFRRNEPLPDIPELPGRGQKNSRQGPPHQPGPKSRSRKFHCWRESSIRVLWAGMCGLSN